jgi:nucleotide-binding universal stress UspA family protein
VLAVPEANLHPALASLADATDGMLVLLPTRRGPLSRLLAGNDYELLLRRGPLPVLALPGSGRLNPIKRVLFPADLSPRSESSLDQAAALCQALGADLHLLHVYGDDRLPPGEVDSARRASAKTPRELMAIDAEGLAGLAARATSVGVSVRSKTAEGRAHAQILAYAAANAIDLIVMASHGPRTLEDILLGSTTVRVIQRAAAPVLALRA